MVRTVGVIGVDTAEEFSGEPRKTEVGFVTDVRVETKILPNNTKPRVAMSLTIGEDFIFTCSPGVEVLIATRNCEKRSQNG